MATEVLNEEWRIGRIWIWKHLSEKPKSPNPDVALPDGFLYESNVPLQVVAKTMVMVALLPNMDLVMGPIMEKAASASVDDREANRIRSSRKEFITDMVYLKYAILHGTIVLDELPVPSRADMYK